MTSRISYYEDENDLNQMLNNRRILIVDDEPYNLLGMQIIIN